MTFLFFWVLQLRPKIFLCLLSALKMVWNGQLWSVTQRDYDVTNEGVWSGVIEMKICFRRANFDTWRLTSLIFISKF